jgi:hypothetical protein
MARLDRTAGQQTTDTARRYLPTCLVNHRPASKHLTDQTTLPKSEAPVHRVRVESQRSPLIAK